MNRIKFLEIRDISTFIPVIAIDLSLTGNSYNDYLLQRAGYGEERCILLTRLQGHSYAEYDPYAWNDRTYRVAHAFICENWDNIYDAEVIDVEYILGETKEKKSSERYI
jgi:hypothetical protein